MRIPNSGKGMVRLIVWENEAAFREIAAIMSATPEENRKALAELIAEEKAQIENEMERKARGLPRSKP